MNAQDIFLSGISTILLFNVFLISNDPKGIILKSITVGTILGMVMVGTSIGITAGLNISVLGGSFGLDDFSVKIIFGFGVLLSTLFQISIPEVNLNHLGLDIVISQAIPVGSGLWQNILQYFSTTEFYGIGFIVVTIIGVLTLISGIVMIIGSD